MRKKQPGNNHRGAGAIAQNGMRSTPVPGAGRDAAAWWPLSSCCMGSGALAMSALALDLCERLPVTLLWRRGGAC